MNDGVHFIGRINCQLKCDLILDWQIIHALFLVRVFAVFVDRAHKGAGVGQIHGAVVFYGHIGVGHFAHAVCNVNARVAAEDIQGYRLNGGEGGCL